MSRGAAALLALPRLVRSLAGIINAPTTLPDSRRLIRQRVENREQQFLAMAARYIYGDLPSPYRQLLDHAGFAYGDLQALVRRAGLERTLEALRDAGVYLSFEEFKGRTVVVRGGRTFHFAERQFDNPLLGVGVPVRTGGSRSRGSAVTLGLSFLADHAAPTACVAAEALQAVGLPLVLWLAGLDPERMAVVLVAMGRAPAAAWRLSPPHDAGSARRVQVLHALTRVLARRRGLRVPKTSFLPVAEVARALEALLRLRDRFGACSLMTSPSAAVRLAAAAAARGESLQGLRIFATMEPLTAGKFQEIRRSGATVGSLYVFTEGGAAAVCCGTGTAPDDMHLMTDSFALIKNRRPMVGIGELDAYMFTSLAAAPPKILLNVESDDFGDLTVRRCGCPLDGLGLHTHLAYVRSFAKLTGEGATILGTDVVRILEEVLPREFGGRSIDYQLLERETAERLTRLDLLVSPAVGPVDEGRLRERFLAELRRGPNRGVGLWEQAESIRVLRREPVPTPRGKVLPFQTQAADAFRLYTPSVSATAASAPVPAGKDAPADRGKAGPTERFRWGGDQDERRSCGAAVAAAFDPEPGGDRESSGDAPG